MTGKVRNLTNFGAFVELEEGIDGLVHISDMSWTRRVVHPSEVLKKGDKVDVVVLSIDKERRRISLGLKQVSEDPWPTLAERYLPDMIVKGKVVRLLDRGVIVDLEDGLEGFIPLSQLGIEGLKKPSDSFKAEDVLELKVTRVDTPGAPDHPERQGMAGRSGRGGAGGVPGTIQAPALRRRRGQPERRRGARGRRNARVAAGRQSKKPANPRGAPEPLGFRFGRGAVDRPDGVGYPHARPVDDSSRPTEGPSCGY